MWIIELLQYVLLGLIQGITEPLPISSSGHLVILKNLFDFNFLSDLNFEIFANFGSLIAIILIFRKDIIKLVSDFINYIKTHDDKFKNNFRYCIMLVIATIPAGIMGLLFKDQIEVIFSNVKFVGVSLLITAAFLFSIRNIKGAKKDNDITIKDAIMIGLFQSVALLPGISRSGSTIVGGSLNKLSRETIIKFSFLLYIPISFATMIVGVSDVTDSSLLLPYIIGALVSLGATFVTTKIFIDIVKKGKLIYFVYYCLLAGVLVILFV